MAHKRVFYHLVSYMDEWPKVVSGDDASSLDGSVENTLPLSRQKMPNDESSCTSAIDNYFVWKRSYDPNNPHQREHEDNLVTMLEHAYTPLSLVEGDAFRRMVTHLDPSI